MDTLTLRGRGVTVTLFAPREVGNGLEAHALLASASSARPRLFSSENDKRRFRVPALPDRGFFMAHVVLPEVKR